MTELNIIYLKSKKLFKKNQFFKIILHCDKKLHSIADKHHLFKEGKL